MIRCILLKLNILNQKRFAKTDDSLPQSCIPKNRRYNNDIITANFFIKRVLWILGYQLASILALCQVEVYRKLLKYYFEFIGYAAVIGFHGNAS